MPVLSVGDFVERDTKEQGYRGRQGRIVQIDADRGRAQVQWENNKTWYRLDRLKRVAASVEAGDSRLVSL